MPFARHGETIRGKGNAVFCPCFSLINLWLILPTWWCLLCIRYGRIKLNCRYVRTCASRRKPKSSFLSECLLVSSRLHEIVLDLFEMKLLLYLILNSKCRRLYDFFTQSANGLIIFDVSKKISPSAEDDKEALPPVDLLNPLPCSHLCIFFYFAYHT